MAEIADVHEKVDMAVGADEPLPVFTGEVKEVKPKFFERVLGKKTTRDAMGLFGMELITGSQEVPSQSMIADIISESLASKWEGIPSPAVPKNQADRHAYNLQKKLEVAMQLLVSISEEGDEEAEISMVKLMAIIKGLYNEVNEERRLQLVGKNTNVLKREREPNALLDVEEEEKLAKARKVTNTGTRAKFRNFRASFRGFRSNAPSRSAATPSESYSRGGYSSRGGYPSRSRGSRGGRGRGRRGA